MFYFSQTSVIIIQNFWEAKVTLYSLYEKPVDSNTFLRTVPHKFVLRPFNSDKLVNSIKSLTKASMLILERFSFECRKVIGFAFTTLRDWLKRFAPLFYPIRRKTKTNCVTLACIFPRFASATCNYFEF